MESQIIMCGLDLRHDVVQLAVCGACSVEAGGVVVSIERQSPAARESCTSSNTTSKKDPHFYPDVSQNTTSRCIWRIMHGDMTLATKRGRVGKQENVPVHKNDPRIFSLVELD